MNDNNAAGNNTLLIVLLIIIVVGGLVWLLTRGGIPAAPGPESTPSSDASLDVDVNLPETPRGTEGTPGAEAP